MDAWLSREYLQMLPVKREREKQKKRLEVKRRRALKGRCGRLSAAGRLSVSLCGDVDTWLTQGNLRQLPSKEDDEQQNMLERRRRKEEEEEEGLEWDAV